MGHLFKRTGNDCQNGNQYKEEYNIMHPVLVQKTLDDYI